MKQAIIFNKFGQILRVVTAPENAIMLQKTENELIKLYDGDVINSYVEVDTLELVNFPEQPSKFHTWNWETKQWQEPENYQQLLFNEAAGKVKQERQRLLATTDWTDTVSASTRLENYNAWQFYRQQLRDITTQEGYPFNVIWPTQPV
jgi:hypothetical protein